MAYSATAAGQHVNYSDLRVLNVLDSRMEGFTNLNSDLGNFVNPDLSGEFDGPVRALSQLGTALPPCRCATGTACPEVCKQGSKSLVRTALVLFLALVRKFLSVCKCRETCSGDPSEWSGTTDRELQHSAAPKLPEICHEKSERFCSVFLLLVRSST